MSDFDDPAYDEIRALLAGARVDGPVPDDVAATLDATLAELVADRAGSAEPRTAEPTTAVVVGLRRRSRSARFLVAAAAVILVGAGGLGLSDVLRKSDDSRNLTSAPRAASDSATTSAASPEVAAGSGTTGSGTTGGNMGSKSVPPPAGTGTTAGTSGSFYSVFIGTRFSRAHFSVQATRYVRGVTELARGDFAGPAPGAAPPLVPQDSVGGAPLDDLAGTLRDSRPTATCPGPTVTDGSTVAVITFEHHRAILVLHPVTKGSRFVVAWSCDGSRLLDFATVRP